MRKRSGYWMKLVLSITESCPDGSTMRAQIAELVRAEGRRNGNDYTAWDDAQVLDMSQ